MLIGWAEIIKALAQLAWPVGLASVVIVYKPELIKGVPEFLRRALKFEAPGGIKLEVGAAEQQKETAITVSESSAKSIELKEIPGLPRTAAMASIEKNLHAALKNVTADKVDVLVRNLAQARLESLFGRIYALIFGSQISGLIQLRARRKVSVDEAHEYYMEFEKKNPEAYAGYGFAGWIGFLVKNELAAYEDKDIVITPYGDDFLTWLEATNLPISKIL